MGSLSFYSVKILKKIPENVLVQFWFWGFFKYKNVDKRNVNVT